jgi:carbamoyltransferase
MPSAGPRAVLGLHAYTHDAAAALCLDGRLAAFAEEERFSRIKGDPAFPRRAIRFCLDSAGVKPSEIAAVAVPFRPRVGSAARLAYLARRPWAFAPRAADLIRKGRRLERLGAELEALGIRAPVGHEDHYAAHARAVFAASPFEEAAVLVLDGVAERWTGAAFHARRGAGLDLTPLARFPFPHSLGLLYAAVTVHLGFVPNREEGKVLAMGALGDGRFLDAFRPLCRVVGGMPRVTQGPFDFAGRWTLPRFERAFGPRREPGGPFLPEHFALARALQSTVEACGLELARRALAAGGGGDLCAAGGLALNPALNQALAAHSGCRRFYAFPPGGDAGTAFGAALAACADPSWSLDHPFLGSPCGIVRTGHPVLAEGGAATEKAAELLEQGALVAVCRGRAEMGPRALGHRSILADPRRAGSKERLNGAVKRREPFQPFAPAVLAGRRADLFAGAADSPYMLRAFPLPDAAREAIPAVVHADGTSRVQTVEPGDASGLAPLLEAFERRTGLPALLNTSLNLKGEPLADSSEDALGVFEHGGLDALLFDDRLIGRMGP